MICDGSLDALAVSTAASLPVERRRSVMTEFFGRHPGAGYQDAGLGRALLEFQEWEIDSGRIPGSAWWSAVNGLLVADIATAMGALGQRNNGGGAAGSNGSSPDDLVDDAAAAWIRFARADHNPQRALWDAHQISINRAAEHCVELLDAEPDAERCFAGFALDLVERSAHVVPTHTGLLGALTRRHYPAGYPTSDAQWASIEAELEAGQSGSR